LSITILPWLGVSIVVLFLITYLPSEAVLVVADLLESPPSWLGQAVLLWLAGMAIALVPFFFSLRRRSDLSGDQRANWTLLSIFSAGVGVVAYFAHFAVTRLIRPRAA